MKVNNIYFTHQTLKKQTEWYSSSWY